MFFLRLCWIGSWNRQVCGSTRVCLVVGICEVVLWCIVVGVGNRVVGVGVDSYVGRVLGRVELVGKIVGERYSVGCSLVGVQLDVGCLIGSWGRWNWRKGLFFVNIEIKEVFCFVKLTAHHIGHCWRSHHCSSNCEERQQLELDCRQGLVGKQGLGQRVVVGLELQECHYLRQRIYNKKEKFYLTKLRIELSK